jgi:N-acetylneuraminic acid mutarotase
MKNTWLVFLLGISLCSSSQTFTWMKGTNILFQAGLYGTQGVSSPTNNPGSRHGAATWVDQQGNLWLFGGEGYDNTTTLCWLNDLWKFNPQTNEWTWIRGNTSGNQPGIYGVQALPSSSAQPGSREFPVSWTDAAGNFWLFGGDGFASTPTFGRLGDLWKYNPVSNQWTWMNGFTIVAQNGNYGTMGVASISNVPGARYAAGSWVDATGNLWMFGGRGFPATGFDGFLNDLWKYNPSSNQ